MNREQRRASERMQRKQELDTLKLSKAKLDSMVRHGIGPDDLARADKKGFERGFVAASKDILKATYAAVMLAAQERFGLDDDELVSFIKLVDNKVTETIDAEELVNELFDRTGVSIHFDGGFDRVERKK